MHGEILVEFTHSFMHMHNEFFLPLFVPFNVERKSHPDADNVYTVRVSKVETETETFRDFLGLVSVSSLEILIFETETSRKN